MRRVCNAAQGGRWSSVAGSVRSPALAAHSGRISVDTLVHTELFIDLDGDGSATAKRLPNIKRLLGVKN
ncbi:hypothetical protein GCM10007858_42570 [Bradyrhizobium liaoningense]|nr:hypothetical protein GCM10007858_42570 [Bradyrhizobium liaoningense]